MTDLTDILVAAIQPPSGNGDIGFHMGLIISWDEITGSNVVHVNGTDIEDLRIIQSGIGVQLQPGDTVALMRFQTTYFITGKVAAAGASAAQQIRSASVNTPVNGFSSSTYVDLPGSFGPEVPDVTIGSSRRCLVLVSSAVYGSQSFGYMSFRVTGASTISPSVPNVAFMGNEGPAIVVSGGNAMASTLLTAADGLNAGLNTFTAKYATSVTGTGTAADFSNRVITVIPY